MANYTNPWERWFAISLALSFGSILLPLLTFDFRWMAVPWFFLGATFAIRLLSLRYSIRRSSLNHTMTYEIVLILLVFIVLMGTIAISLCCFSFMSR
jgi:hypothetical protein